MAAKSGLPQEAAAPNAITPALIEEIKQALAQAGLPQKLYKYKFEETEVVFRPLLIADYVKVQEFIKANENTIRQDAIDRKICEAAIIFPEELLNPRVWDLQPAGLQGSLAQQVLARSGFVIDQVDQRDYMSIEPLTTVEAGPKPDPAVVEQLKAKYKFPLKLAQVDSEFYVLRPITRGEWRALSTEEQTDIDLLTAERGCIWSRDYPESARFTERPAGIARSVSEWVMQISGFNATSSIEEL